MADLTEPTSLAETLDRVTAALLSARPPGAAARRKAAAFIASRQGLPGSYRGLFAPTEGDGGRDLRLFTGERVTTRAGRAHILGEEACRALLGLGVETRATRAALGEAQLAMIPVLEETEARQRDGGGRFRGEFCCAACSAALWRNMTAGGFEEIGSDRWLAAGVKTLAAHRDGAGWGRFPFWYTLLALEEIEGRAADVERRHAAPRLERALRRRSKEGDPYDARRRELAARILARC